MYPVATSRGSTCRTFGLTEAVAQSKSSTLVKSTPCFVMLACRLASSHSYTKRFDCTHNQGKWQVDGVHHHASLLPAWLIGLQSEEAKPERAAGGAES